MTSAVGHGSVELAERVVQELGLRRLTLAVAESLTGGLVMAALTAVPGASGVLRGGPVVYATDTKATVLDVDAALLAERGPVDPEVAASMARSVRRRWAADLGLATTGVAGPDPQAGHRVGEVYVALADDTGSTVLRLDLAAAGGRAAIRAGTVERALVAVLERFGLAGEVFVG